MAHIDTWAGEPHHPTTFGRCVRTQFLALHHGRRTRMLHAQTYLELGQEAEHAAQLHAMGIARFQHLGHGQDVMAMAARAIDNRKLAVRFAKRLPRRPDHRLIVPALFTQKPTDDGYGFEILPRVKTKGIRERDVFAVAVNLASSGLWVEDLHDENIGHWRGRLAVYDIGSGVYDYWDRPKAFRRSLRTFVNLNRRRRPHDTHLIALQAIVDGEARPRPLKAPKAPRPLALPAAYENTK